MCTCMTTTWSAQPYPLFDLMEVPIIGKWKADLRQRSLRWFLDNVSLWGARLLARRSMHVVSLADFMPPICPGPDGMSAVMFSRGTEHRWKPDGPLLCLCRMTRGTDRREWMQREREKRGKKSQEREAQRAVLLIYGSVIPVPLKQPEIPQYCRMTVPCPRFYP